MFIQNNALFLLAFNVLIRFLRWSPLRQSSERGHLEVCKYLISAQADVGTEVELPPRGTMRMFIHNNALFRLVCKVIIRFLRESPLHWASERGHLNVCKYLISAHADV